MPSLILSENSFAKTPAARQAALEARKRNMIEMAREKYLKKHNTALSGIPPIQPKRQPAFHAKRNIDYIGEYLAEQDVDYGFPIALTLIGMGSVGVLAVGVSLGIMTSPILIVAGFAIAGLIPVVWLMHWLINARPELPPTQASHPSASRFQALGQKITAFFSLEQKASDQKHVTHQSAIFSSVIPNR